MGMYTELIFGAALRRGTPSAVVDTIKHYVLDEPCDRPLVSLVRHLNGGSYYFGASESYALVKLDPITEQWIVSFRCNIKNYNREIETFLEWVQVYIEDGSGTREMYAVVTYEEDAEPTLYFLHDQ